MLSSAASAETSPYSFGAGITLGTDSNLFRAPPGEAVSDRFSVASAFANLDQSIGRQRLQASATVRSSRFAERDDLDNTGYGAQFSWDGATSDRLSWRLSYSANRTLASYATVVDPALRTANIETTRQALVRVQLGLVSTWVADATLSRRSLAYSAAEYARQQHTLDSLGVGAQWQPVGPLSASIGPRVTRGRYPQARQTADGFQADGFDRQDIDFGLRWAASGASTLSARMSLTRQRYELLSERDFSGATGQLNWHWQPTAKTRFDTTLARETGSESSFFALSLQGLPLRGVGDNSQLTTSLALRADHELTGKVSLSLSTRFAERRLAASTSLAGTPLLIDSMSGSERHASFGAGVRWLPMRNAVVGCDLEHQRRNADTTLSSAYRATALSCNAQLSVR